MIGMQMVRGTAVCAALLIAASASAQKASTEAVAKTLVKNLPAPTQGFSIVLVVGDLQTASTPDNVPAAARKALADMKDFLPYKGYRLVDTAWILGSARATSRLHGPEDQEYEVNLSATGPFGDSKSLRVDFALREGASDPTPPADRDASIRLQQRAELTARQAQLEDELRAMDKSGQAMATAMAEQRSRLALIQRAMEDLDRGFTRRNQIINTSFTMEVGETVVVGTSRLKGDKALIALLTAVPRTK